MGAALLDRLTQLGHEQIRNVVGKLGEDIPGKLGEVVKDKLGGIGTGGGISVAAAVGAAQAKLAGKNPILGAIRAGIGAIPTKLKVALVVGLILILLLAPVLAVLALLALLVIGVVMAIRSAAG